MRDVSTYLLIGGTKGLRHGRIGIAKVALAVQEDAKSEDKTVRLFPFSPYPELTTTALIQYQKCGVTVILMEWKEVDVQIGSSKIRVTKWTETTTLIKESVNV